jgi:UDP:flavonoid glycosyltransferase YjiC (YdhE family)
VKFVLAGYGSRGDIVPSAAVGRELLRRGHEVCIAVPPNFVGFVESAGLAAVAYGLDTRIIVEMQRKLATRLFRNCWRIPDLIRLWRQQSELGSQCWGEMSMRLTSLADGADLLVTSASFERPPANIAEYHDIPFATLHYLPVRPNGRLLPFLPAPLGRSAMTVYDWLGWRLEKKFEDAQRRELGLSKATGPLSRRITERGSLEIQAYDEVCFPGLAAEWEKFDRQRPFVGALTMELPTDADEEVASWIGAGTPPIFFGFGSTAVKSPADMLAMISAACAQLGERALVCSAESDFRHVPHFEHVNVVDTMNYAAIFPTCRAVVHHGGAGTTAIGLRAGVPTLILSTGDPGQAACGAMVKRLKVGTARRFSSTTRESLVEDLRTILAPHCVTRAREIVTRMTNPADSVAAAADLVEDFARSGRVG